MVPIKNQKCKKRAEYTKQWLLRTNTKVLYDISGAQPGIFEGRGGFCKLGDKFLAVLKAKVKCKALENICCKNINRLIFALISETKIDSSFPSVQFYLEGYATPD